MTASTWQHAAVAASALAGERAETLRGALADALRPGVDARRRHVDGGADVASRARRIIAERVRATRLMEPTARPASRAARVLALWLLGCAPGRRAALARTLSPELLAEVRAEVSSARAHAAHAPLVARWMRCALRALGRAPQPREWDELIAELAGQHAARGDAAQRVERSLRVAGLRAASEAAARALAEER